MNERLKNVREFLNISQEKFGRQIGIKSRGHMSSLESGSKPLTDRIINDICREFKVNEDWLRYGIGEMFVPDSSEEIESLAKKYNLDDVSKAFLKVYLTETSEMEKRVISSLFVKFVRELQPEVLRYLEKKE